MALEDIRNALVIRQDGAFLLTRLRQFMPAIRAGLEWMRVYGDRDADGFLEYERRSMRGLLNQR